MLLNELLADGRRQLEICNACRYCEGLCGVFPAIERRTTFAEGDLTHLANLCHDCRACFDACPFAPPHELAVDIPLLLSTVREQTYSTYAWPRWLSDRVDRRLSSALAFAGLAVVLVVAATIVGGGLDRLFAVRTGPGSFYEVVPWLAMMVPFMAISLFALAIMLAGGARFWRDTGPGSRGPVVEARSLMGAIRDAGTLRYMRGGGPGCTYPDGRPNRRRLIYHSLVFYGFILAFLSTVSAAILQDVFGVMPPYSLLSLPVAAGSLGGAGLIAGCLGLLGLKPASDPARTAPAMRTMDIAFLLVMILVNVTGFALLALRETALMGLMLDIHLGFVAALFLTLPYGKFPHSIYRSLALLRDRIEVYHQPVRTD